ncbi:MAG: hypothetical protein LBN27_09315 [Prevotellaceae bacterium]|jgi:hypothetical protein|nr:hypothetical protein [Prevotellaceae bacterium]
MKKHTLFIFAITLAFSACKQKEIEPYEKRDIIKEHLLGDWYVADTQVEMEVATWALPAKELATSIIKNAISSEVKDDVLRIAEDKAYCFRDGQVFESTYLIGKDTLFFEETKLLGFPIPHILIYQDSLIQDKMTAYMEKDEIINILIDMGETKHIDIIKSAVDKARCNLRFRKIIE